MLLAAERAHGPEVVRTRDVDATFTLQRLEQHGRHVLALERLLECGHVVVGHMDEALGQRLERGVLLGLSGRRQRGQGPPVK